MKKNTPLKAKLFIASFAVLLSTGLLSCTNNDTTGTSTNMDSSNSMTSGTSNMNDNRMNATSDNNTQNNGAIDSSATDIAGNTAFMMKAAEINREEIKLGKLAQQKGTMDHVKELGKMMVTAHTQAMNDLTALAKTKMIVIPPAETEKAKDAFKVLNAKSGKEFDKAYSAMMVNGHKEAIALFEKTVMDTKDADVKLMASTMIPKLKTHLTHAETCKMECDKM
ncbi:MAG: DUF4142 domain-containing protein [Ferruginibacter sp.]|nr:DUF4142 domain-containing protein [Ferruginibacter sp.]